ncbi:MAG: methionyl-tRNA formyltransferase [Acidobacteria bacterium]|nr:methionyl-tRNA formyltransferase [Acidobacteriota bacterium]
MRLVFLGSGQFAVPSLEHLCRRGLAPAAVITQPDRPAGRGRRPAPTPLKVMARSLGLSVSHPESIGAPEALAQLRDLDPDFLVVAAYGQILTPEVLQVGRLAPVNLHASLLPRWRGASPIARAILAGDPQTGLTTMRMDAGIDTGDILLQEEVKIGARETAGELEIRLADLGGALLEKTLLGLQEGSLQPRPQPSEGVTRAPRLSVDEARLDWSLAADDLDRRVRAYNPRPVAWTEFRGQRLKIWGSRPVSADVVPDGESPPRPGTVTVVSGDTLRVACGRAALDLLEIQPAGGRRSTARDAINGRTLRKDDRLGA